MNARIGAIFLALALLGAAGPSPRPAVRVVALVPSLVEDLFAVGAGPQVVAVSSFSDNVTQAKNLPRVADFTSVDTERIVALHPDLVLGIPSQERLVAPLKSAGIDVQLIANDSYSDIFADLATVGAATGHQREAAAEIAHLTDETKAIQAKSASFARHPTVFVVLGTAPIWTVGAKSYIATLIEMAGGRNAADDLTVAYGVYSAEALLRAQPDVLVTDPAIHLPSVLDREPWRSLHAVQRGRVYTIDPPEMLMRPGPNYNEGLRWLIERLKPLAAS